MTSLTPSTYQRAPTPASQQRSSPNERREVSTYAPRSIAVHFGSFDADVNTWSLYRRDRAGRGHLPDLVETGMMDQMLAAIA